MPPAPSGASISYGPSLVPEERAMRAGHYIPQRNCLAADSTILDGWQPLPYRITEGLPVTRNNPDRSASQLRGGHFYVVARINHWRVRNTETRGPRSRPQFSLFLKEAFGKVQLGSLRFCVLAQSQKLTVIGLGLRTSTR